MSSFMFLPYHRSNCEWCTCMLTTGSIYEHQTENKTIFSNRFGNINDFDRTVMAPFTDIQSAILFTSDLEMLNGFGSRF